MPRFVHKIVPANAADESILNKLGEAGWRLAASAGDRLFLVKEAEEAAAPQEHFCVDCLDFPVSHNLLPKEAMSLAGRCGKWGIDVSGSSTGCETFKAKQIPTEKGVIILDMPFYRQRESTPDDPSAWHWQPNTNAGEKRVEAVTSQVSGVLSPEHKHRVQAIVCKEGKVIRGKTDMVNGHAHVISFLGMTEEADGHTHTFVVPAKVGG